VVLFSMRANPVTLPLKLAPVFDRLFTCFSSFLEGDNDGSGTLFNGADYS
jgi:hypothetical protein